MKIWGALAKKNFKIVEAVNCRGMAKYNSVGYQCFFVVVVLGRGHMFRVSTLQHCNV